MSKAASATRAWESRFASAVVPASTTIATAPDIRNAKRSTSTFYARPETCAACEFCIQSHPLRSSTLDNVATHGTTAGHGHAPGSSVHAHGHEDHELGFWRKYIFSQDHK